MRVLGRRKLAPLGIEAQSIVVALRDRIAAALPKIELVPTDGLVERLRLIKDKDEVDVIRHAAQVAERAFEVLRATHPPGFDRKAGGRRLGAPNAAVGGQGFQFSADRGRWSAGRASPRPTHQRPIGRVAPAFGRLGSGRGRVQERLDASFDDR